MTTKKNKKGWKEKMKKLLKENKLFIITILLISILFNIRLPYYVNAPGGTININNRIVYEEKKQYEGSFNMLYVTEYKATIPTFLMSYIIKDWDTESISESRVSNETAEEIEYRNKIMLENSINNAKYIAYKEAKKDITVVDKKTVVIGTTEDNGLKIGDIILEINNQPVIDINTIKKEIDSHKVRESLTIKIKRNNKIKTQKVEIKKSGENKILGVVIVTNYEYQIDPEIELKFKNSESGSSGGMMMALSIYSTISGEDLLKGRNIAGTGTIDEEGNIGEISGIKYKIIGAYKNHMDIVLVPSDNYEEALSVVKERKYDMKVIEIKKFNEAVEYLKNTK